VLLEKSFESPVARLAGELEALDQAIAERLIHD
jgi:hypothetical protein